MVGRRVSAIALVLALLGAACHGQRPRVAPSVSIRRYPTGGTLRVAIPKSFFPFPSLDPQKAYGPMDWELLRCCLLRTLLNFRGLPTREGGTIPRPDLATRLPSLSADGLTWTFPIRHGVHYAPPLAQVQVTAQDFIRALEREADPKASKGGYAPYYSVIQGFDDVTSGRAQTISGLEAPDPFTLRVHLTHPEGDLGDLFTLPATAPIPPNPSDPTARFGIAQGHDDDLSGFLVASGPYMVEGSGTVDFSAAAGEQRPAPGFADGRSIALVRNPSWRLSQDAIRPAYVDRIQVTEGGTLEADSALIDEGTQDLVLYPLVSPQVPPAQLSAYQRDPSQGMVDAEPRDAIRYVSMNLAVPPLDDIHVRTAINLAVDKQAVLTSLGGPTAGRITNHIALDSLEENLLLNYDPFPTPDHHGDPSAAMEAMAASRYDRDHDGRCDTAVCHDLLALTLPSPAAMAASKVIAEDLRAVGIDLKVEVPDDIFAVLDDPTKKVPMALDIAWIKDIPSASNYFTPLFLASSIGAAAGANYALLGATSDQLRSWGYSVTSVPSVDDRIGQCLSISGSQAAQCWSSLDQYLMTQVVPWVPLISENHVQVVPSRIAHYSYDQFGDLPALDQIALRS
jgi:peptide/nickel transport system substrate-binding protein